LSQGADPHEVTAILREARGGDRSVLDRLFPLVYDELRRMAHHQLIAQPPGRTLATTVLIHEAYLRLVNQKEVGFDDRARFLAYASRVMRTVLVDYARARGAKKRGGGMRPVPIDVANLQVDEQADLVLGVDDALDRLAALDERQARIVECRFFGGMSEAETAEALGISDRTVRRDWTKSRAWLQVELAEYEP
jgi:RNA polymerase sigma factor (TIGR02999 family)